MMILQVRDSGAEEAVVTALRAPCPLLPSREPVGWVAGQTALLVPVWAGVGLTVGGWLAGVGYGLAVSVLLARAACRRGVRALGPADRVTLVRAGLVGVCTALVVSGWGGGAAPAGLITAVAAAALLLDAVDGHVARRTGTASALGARFDMEVDAYLILLLSVQVAGRAGAWVVVIGAMRYAFVAAGWALPWLRAALPPRRSRKVTAAVQGVVLAAAASEAFSPSVTALAAGLALTMLTWSFGRDVRWLWRNRHRGDGRDEPVRRTAHRQPG
ncbi:Phosphatidylglycerophosphate synthase [Thermostaphylospora chromogena]|uniref:Phosphatidylglycerophosphate synthase n=1 Tax=Thermostaphylospora chromogena TaxID=35622 RepID=A0A1H1HRM0_9ACTN|nr:Phosphatidylglycerophosphate synthase [Thermostaphylospora chromogena]